MLDRFVYLIRYSEDGSLRGYVDFTLSVFNTSEWNDASLVLDRKLGLGNVSQCFYKGYHHPPGHPREYEKSEKWYEVVLVKVTFVLLYEIFIRFVQGFIQYVIPDESEDVRLHVQRNRYIQKSAAYYFEEEVRKRKETMVHEEAEKRKAEKRKEALGSDVHEGTENV